MNRTNKPFTTVLAVLLVGVVISVGSRAFAQGGGGYDTFPTSRLGYDPMAAPAAMELSDTTPNRTIQIAMAGNTWLKEKPDTQKQTLSWETGAGKSYLIPALEIPAFLLLLNGYDRLAFGERFKLVFPSHNPATFWRLRFGAVEWRAADSR